MSRAALQGSLRDLPLADVLQLLDLGGRTGVLRVRLVPDEMHGAILFADGRVRGAATRGSAAAAAAAAVGATAAATQEAVLALLEWRHGEFAFVLTTESPASPSAPVVGVDVLLMESARRADDWAQVADAVPNADVPLALADGGDGDLVELTPGAWALLALVDGRRTVRQLAASLGVEPVVVARDARLLVRAGLAVVPGAPPDGAPDGGPAAVAGAVARSS